MEKCDIEAISALLDGELPEDGAARLRAHIGGCSSCKAVYEDFSALRDGFAALDTDAPDTLLPGTVYRLTLGEEPPRGRSFIGRAVRVAAGIAACLLVAQFISHTAMKPKPSYDNSEYTGESEIEKSGAGGSGAADSGTVFPDAAPMPNGSITQDYNYDDGMRYDAPGGMSGSAAEPGEAPPPDMADGGTESGFNSVEDEPSPSPDEPSPSEEPSPEPSADE